MFYEAGVEEFLTLAKNAEYVVTNSFHGAIFAVQFRRPFRVFTREQADTKINELMALLSLRDRIWKAGDSLEKERIDWAVVDESLVAARERSLSFVDMELERCPCSNEYKD